ncbi:hypothetical protein CHISP_3319 [Chitinispirillum alkaliphilum]|nr:hypothetical protein CHISP_3319 [Chitinispirillum alkaliphilum]
MNPQKVLSQKENKQIGFLSFKRKLICFLTFLLLLTSLTQGNYYIQVKASAEKDSIHSFSQKYSELSIPFVITEIQKDGSTMYRLRLGAFKNRDDAISVSSFLGVENTWIVNDREVRPQAVVSSIVSDQIRFNVLAPGYIIYRNADLICLYKYKFGFEGSRAPGDLYLFSGERSSYLKIEGVTGFNFRDSVFEIGVPKYVVTDPAAKVVDVSSPEVISFARDHGISAEKAISNLQLFDADFSQRVNIKHYIDLEKMNIVNSNQIGCDYFLSDTDCKKINGFITLNVQFGNYKLNGICTTDFGSLAGNRLIVLTKPVDEYSIEFCSLFLK